MAIVGGLFAVQARLQVQNKLDITSFLIDFETCQRWELVFLPIMFNECI